MIIFAFFAKVDYQLIKIFKQYLFSRGIVGNIILEFFE